jgi:hypothetical protein
MKCKENKNEGQKKENRSKSLAIIEKKIISLHKPKEVQYEGGIKSFVCFAGSHAVSA